MMNGMNDKTRNCELMLNSARKVYTEIFDSKIYSFSTIVRSELPEKAGVYAIWLKDTGEVLYVGRTRNIKQRLYTNHLMGNKLSARLKKYLVEDDINHPEIDDYVKAKEYIRQNCNFQFILCEDNNERGHIEGLLGYLTQARYIESEH